MRGGGGEAVDVTLEQGDGAIAVDPHGLEQLVGRRWGGENQRLGRCLLPLGVRIDELRDADDVALVSAVRGWRPAVVDYDG